MTVSLSGSDAATGAPAAVPAGEFSATLRVVDSPSSNTGGSFSSGAARTWLTDTAAAVLLAAWGSL